MDDLADCLECPAGMYCESKTFFFVILFQPLNSLFNLYLQKSNTNFEKWQFINLPACLLIQSIYIDPQTYISVNLLNCKIFFNFVIIDLLIHVSIIV